MPSIKVSPKIGSRGPVEIILLKLNQRKFTKITARIHQVLHTLQITADSILQNPNSGKNQIKHKRNDSDRQRVPQSVTAAYREKHQSQENA